MQARCVFGHVATHCIRVKPFCSLRSKYSSQDGEKCFFIECVMRMPCLTLEKRGELFVHGFDDTSPGAGRAGGKRRNFTKRPLSEAVPARLYSPQSPGPPPQPCCSTPACQLKRCLAVRAELGMPLTVATREVEVPVRCRRSHCFDWAKPFSRLKRWLAGCEASRQPYCGDKTRRSGDTLDSRSRGAHADPASVDREGGL